MDKIVKLLTQNQNEENYILQVYNPEKNTNRYYIFLYEPNSNNFRICRITSIGTLLDYLEQYQIETEEISSEMFLTYITNRLYCFLMRYLDAFDNPTEFESMKIVNEFKVDQKADVLEDLTPEDVKILFNTYNIENKNYFLNSVHTIKFNRQLGGKTYDESR